MYPKNDGSLPVDSMRLSIVLVAFSLERHVMTTFVTSGFVASCLQASMAQSPLPPVIKISTMIFLFCFENYDVQNLSKSFTVHLHCRIVLVPCIVLSQRTKNQEPRLTIICKRPLV